jgi:hypothetical protein
MLVELTLKAAYQLTHERNLDARSLVTRAQLTQAAGLTCRSSPNATVGSAEA